MTAERQRAVKAAIERLAVPDGMLAVWSLGQSGFVIKGGSTIVYIDPYLSDSVEQAGGPPRRFPAPLDAATVDHADLVLATHEHLDHADAATLGPLMAASPRALLVSSPQGRDVALAAGVAAQRTLVPRLGETLTIGALRVTAVPAAHYDFEVDGDGRSRWLGFLIELNGVRLYHSGDTVLFPELLAALEGVPIDLALLPINGRDYFREQQGIIGNLSPREAVELAATLRAGVLIACHNDLFAANRVNPGQLFDELDRHAPWQRCHLLQPGELYFYAG
jgi:L-ascorbate 6-phosphate lactonase